MVSLDENEKRILSLYNEIKKLNGELTAISEPTQMKLTNAYINIVDEQLSETKKDGEKALNIQKAYKKLKDTINSKTTIYSLAVIGITTLIFGVNEVYVGGLINAILARMALIVIDGVTIIYCSKDIIKEFDKMHELESTFANNPLIKNLYTIDICDCNLKKHIESALLNNKKETLDEVTDKKNNLIVQANTAIKIATINSKIDEYYIAINTILTSMTPKEYEELQRRIPSIAKLKSSNQDIYSEGLSLTK